MAEFHPLRDADQLGSVSWQHLNDVADERAKTCTPAKMPSLNHARLVDYQNVYEPSDDTYLLLDGILKDLQLDELPPISPLIVMEIGTGSGVPITFLTKHLRETCHQPCVAMATDINPNAIRFAKKTATENGIPDLELIRCDLASPFMEELVGKADIILFNPPYVPTPNEEVAGHSIAASWAGGDKGRLVIDRALPQVARLLTKSTKTPFIPRCYMITVDDNEPEVIAKTLKSDYNLQMVPWVRRRANNEYLTAQKITRWLEPEG